MTSKGFKDTQSHYDNSMIPEVIESIFRQDRGFPQVITFFLQATTNAIRIKIFKNFRNEAKVNAE